MSASGPMGAVAPLPALAAGVRFGLVDVGLDPGGVTRRVFLTAGLNAPR